MSTEVGIDVEWREAIDDRDYACDLGGHRRWASSRTRGFTTDVEQVGPLRNERKSVVDRGGRIDISAASENESGVGVDDSADQRSLLRQATQQAIAGAHR